MIGPTGAVKVMIATKPVDFRKGAEGLAALVRETMGADPFSGAIYVFRAKRADRIKLVYFDGYDLDGWDQLRGPTDLSRMPYGELVEDPEPDTDPFPRLIPRSPSGTLFFDDIRPQRFELTPGTFNDSGSEHLRQSRFIPGDINFDGRVDQADIDVARALSGANLRDRITSARPTGQDQYRWQCGAAQQIMAMLSLTQSQNSNGVVGPEHVQVVESLAAKATR